MKHLSLSRKLSACAGAFALTLLIGTLTASALQVAKPATMATAPANARPAPNTLTPAAPMSSRVSSSAGEDIRDIRQPRHVPTVPPWGAVAAGVVLFSAAAFAVWRWLRRGKFLQMLPHEIALQRLEEARRLMDPEHAREYCFAVSNIIRRYVEDRFHVQAPKLTTEEFLRDLVEVRDTMLESHRALLGEFLEHCDLAKFAGWRYSTPDLEAMHASGRSFVQQTSVSAAMAAPKSTPQLAEAMS
jgi:hypothetical protein